MVLKEEFIEIYKDIQRAGRKAIISYRIQTDFVKLEEEEPVL